MNDKSLSLALLRISLGLFFLIPGLSKLMDPAGITGMLSGLGFPIPIFFAWILLLSEIIFGGSLLIGQKVRFAVWPLFIILITAALLVALPNLSFSNSQSVMTLLWHLVGLAGLITVRAFGPGKLFS